METWYVGGGITVEAAVVASRVGIKCQLVWASAQLGFPWVKNRK
ncbi:MAG: hypothetical protein ACTSQH_05355 [Candidatus Hodarchaeales archaeon]